MRILCAFLIFSLLSAVSCGTGGEPSGTDEVIVRDGTVAFTDAAGAEHSLRIPEEPLRVVCLYASFTTLWYEAGGTAVGCIGGEAASELYISSVGRDVADDPGMTVVSLSSNPSGWNVERIIALAPDLILCSTAMNGWQTIAPAAKTAGIEVVAVDYEDFGDYMKWFRVFSALNRREDLWENVALDVQRAVNDVIERAKDPPHPRVLALFTGTKGLQLSGGATTLGGMLAALGAVNAAGGIGRIDADAETVCAAAADVIVVQYHTSEADARRSIERSLGAVWDTLPAVKNGRVYFLDRSLFHQKPNRRFAEAYETLLSFLSGS